MTAYATYPAAHPLHAMTQARWNAMPRAQRDAIRDLSDLTPQLIGLEGWRVEVETEGGSVYRFQVGRSTGWRPCHIALHNARSHGGGSVSGTPFKRVTPIRKVR